MVKASCLAIIVCVAVIWPWTTVFAVINDYPYFQNFEAFPLGDTWSVIEEWVNEATPTDNFNWTANINGTPSSYGPSFDHTKGPLPDGVYLYTEATGHTSSTAIVTSPQFNLRKLKYPRFSVWWHQYGTGMGWLYIEVWNGTSWDTVASYRNNPGVDQWLRFSYDITAYKPVGTTQVRFRGVIGNYSFSDMAIDDFGLYDTATPYYQDFETFTERADWTVQADWVNASDDDYNWTVDSDGTPTSQTGPSLDHTRSPFTGGNYLYTEGEGVTAGQVASLLSPEFNIVRMSSPHLSFWYHQYGSTMGTLAVDVWNGETWTEEASLSGTLNQWQRHSIDLRGYKIHQTVTIRFRGIMGSGDSSDMAIDDVLIHDAAFPYFQDFEKFGQGAVWSFQEDWQNVTYDDFNWTVDRDGTPSSNTGPSYDHTWGSGGSGNYLYFEASGPAPGATTILESPLFNVGGLRSLTILFYYHMYGSTMGTLYFEVWNGSSWVTRLTLSQNLNEWSYASSDLTPYLPLGELKFRFRGSCGSSWVSDMAIDDIQLYDPSMPYYQNFETFPENSLWSLQENWMNPTNDNYNWTADSDGTPTAGTGPSYDHTVGPGNGGKYLYAEATGQTSGNLAIVTSPNFTISEMRSPRVNFWYHTRGTGMGGLYFDVFYGGSWSTRGYFSQNRDQWYKFDFDLTSYIPYSTVKFRWIANRGPSDSCDMAIDDFAIFDTLTAGWGREHDLILGRFGHTATLLYDGTLLIAGGFSGSGNAPSLFNTVELLDPTGKSAGTVTGSLCLARANHTANLLPDGRVLVTGGYGAGGALDSCEIYDPASRVWTATTSMAHARYNHTATVLPDGRVLVVAGFDTDVQETAEVYDPETGVWITAASLTNARENHVAVLLGNGNVLVAGGSDGTSHSNPSSAMYGSTSMNSVEIFDPSTASWTIANTMLFDRTCFTASLLEDGRVLVCGGHSTSSGDRIQAEIFRPDTGTWSQTDNLDSARFSHSSTVLPNGRVFVTSGQLGSNPSSEVYDPGTESWSAQPSMEEGSRLNHTATLTPDGSVFVIGGKVFTMGWEILGSIEVYTPVRAQMSRSSVLLDQSSDHTCTVIPGGRILVAGGRDASGYYSSAQEYDPSSGLAFPTNPMFKSRILHTATLLPSGKVLVTGGKESASISLDDAELYDPASGTWSQISSNLSSTRAGHTATLLRSGKVLLVGDGTGADIYDPVTNTFSAVSSMWFPRSFHTATLLHDGTVLVTGGTYHASASHSSAEIFDPDMNTWTVISPMIYARQYHTATLLPSGKVLITGGEYYNTTPGLFFPQDSAEIFDPASRTFSVTQSMSQKRAGHRAVLLMTGEVLVYSGSDVEIFDPSTETWQISFSLLRVRQPNGYYPIPGPILLEDGRVAIIGGWNSTDGYLDDIEEYSLDYYQRSRQPVIYSVTDPVSFSDTVSIDGIGFRGDSEASSGTTSSSPTNYPLVCFHALESGQRTWLNTGDSTLSSVWEYADPITIDFEKLPMALFPGWYYLSVITHGVPSVAWLVQFDCNARFFKHPESLSVLEGLTAYFSVETNGADGYQWYVDGAPIPGATTSDYTTPPLTPDDNGAQYSCEIYNDCLEAQSNKLMSNIAILTVLDGTSPTVDVIAPDGNEQWDFSAATTARSLHLIAWQPADNFGIESLSRTKISYTTTATTNAGVMQACYDEEIQAPVCRALGAECVSGTLLTGRDSIAGGAEPHQPNTIGGLCADGTAGAWHTGPSIDRVRVFTTSGGVFANAANVTIQVTVWAENLTDSIDIFYSHDALANPVNWTLVSTHQPTTTGLTTLTATTTLAVVGANLQAFRAQYRIGGSASPCVIGDYNERDDLVFAVNAGEHWTCLADSSGTDCSATNISATDTLDPLDTTFLWELPTQAEAAAVCQVFPSATAKIKIEIWDGGDNTTSDTSAATFYIVQPTTSEVKSIILWHSGRITASYPGECGGDCVSPLLTRLVRLADHPKVNGKIVDFNELAPDHPILSAYAAWNVTPTDQGLANAVGTAIRDHLYNDTNGLVTTTYTYARYVILVGDDVQIPFYRMNDGTMRYRESNYPVEGSLSVNTTIGAALNADKILTDSFYGELVPHDPGIAGGNMVYQQDLAVGRLLEHPQQMMTVIDSFITHDGQVNVLSSSERILVTGYDLFYNSACNAKRLFSETPYLKPTDSLLDSPDVVIPACGDSVYTANILEQALFDEIPHRINIINSHANHWAIEASDLSFLTTAAMEANARSLDGTIGYSSGCHAGLNVPRGETIQLDLPELMAEKGVLAWIGNTGYGWGTTVDSAYTELLMENLSVELMESGSIAIGRALANIRRDYYLDQVRYDQFDEKVLHQFNLFGIPNTIVMSYLDKGNDTANEARLPSPDDNIDSACIQGVCLEKNLTSDDDKAIPPGVTVLELQFTFGEPPACSQPAGPYTQVSTDLGNYFALNGIISIEGGDAIQPMFVYNSTLSGTNAHGVLFSGGPYCEIVDFDPVIVEPRNDKCPLPEETDPSPMRTAMSSLINTDASLGALKSIGQVGQVKMPFRTGYLEETPPESGTYNEYLFNSMAFSVYYHKDSTDFDPPIINNDINPGPGGFHTLDGMTATFAITVRDDDSAVYRVLITYNSRQAPDATSDGQWQTHDLAWNESSQQWEGSVLLSGLQTLYYVQAVDAVGNVAVLSISGTDPYGGGTEWGTTWKGPATFEINLPDGDGDGFADDWEDLYPDCLNRLVFNTDEDVDFDYLPHSLEFKYGTNPCFGDSDGGGDNDGSELNNGRKPDGKADDKHISIDVIDNLDDTFSVTWADDMVGSDNAIIDGYYFVYRSNDSPHFDPSELISVTPIPHCSPRPECTSDGDADDHAFIDTGCTVGLCFYKVWNYALDTSPPNIDFINPGVGPTSGNTAVAIYGQYFVTGATVTFNGVPATNVVVSSPNYLTCRTPAYTDGPCPAGCPVTVGISNPNGQQDSVSNGFQYIDP